MNANTRHQLETPISTIKTILNILDSKGFVDERMRENSAKSFQRIKSILDGACNKANEFDGVYRLKSFKVNGLDWGEKTVGKLIYLKGNFSFSITCEKRTNKSNDCLLFYSGSYKFIKDRVEHYVEIASSLERVGKVENLKLEEDGDLLILLTEGVYGRARHEWEKIK